MALGDHACGDVPERQALANCPVEVRILPSQLKITKCEALLRAFVIFILTKASDSLSVQDFRQG